MKTSNTKLYNRFFYSICSAIIIAVFALSCSEEKPTEELFAPMLSNNGATNIARTSATLKGNISGNTNAIKEYGFKCSTSEAFPSDQTIITTIEGTSFTNITAQVEGLEPNTHYYYCVFASTGASDLQANAGEFTTLATVSPTFGEMRIDSIGENVIKVSCNVEEIGDNVLMEYGISYRTEASETFIPIAAKEFNNAATMDYTVEITGLQAETRYIVRPYAKNSSTASGENGVLEGYGTTQTITTESLLSPQVITDQMGTPGISSITISGIVTEATGSNGKIDEVGFCWSTTTNEPTIMEDHIIVEGHTELNKQFSVTLTDLLAKTQYYVRAYAKNTVDGKSRYGYGEVKTFTTANLQTPQLNINESTTTATSISITATISNYDAGALVEKGFIWSTSDAQVTLDNAGSNIVKVTDGENVFTSSIKGLNMNTRYYLRAYAIYEASGIQQIGYSSYSTITTNNFNDVTFDYILIKDETPTSVNIEAAIIDVGNGELIEKGFVWAPDGVEPSLENKESTKIVIDGETYATVITGLTPGSRYYAKAYAITQIEGQTKTSYSTTTSFYTQEFIGAIIDYISLTNVSYNSADVSAMVSSIGNGELVEKGFVWSADGIDPSLDNKESHKVVVEGDTFSATLTDLAPANAYYVKAYVITQIEGQTKTSYSGASYFTTEDFIGASIDNINVTNISYNSADVSAMISSIGNGELVEKGFVWSIDGIDPSLDNKESYKVVVEGEEFSTTLAGLNIESGYYVKAYAITQIEGQTKTSYSGINHFWTEGFTGASINYIDVTNVSYKSADVSATISEMKYGELIEKGFVWTLSDKDPTLENATKIIVTNEQFSATMESLAPNTGYHVKAYTISQLEEHTIVNYSGRYGFNTSGLRFAEISFSDDWTNSTAFSMGFTGTILTEGDEPTTEMGVLWKKWDGNWTGVRPEDCEGKVTFTKQTDGSYAGAIPNLPGRELQYEYYSKIVLNGVEYFNYHGSSVRGTDQMNVESFNYSNTATSISLSCIAKDLEKLSQYKEVGFVYMKYKEGEDINWDKATKVACTPDGNNQIATTIENLNSGDTYALSVYITTELGTAYDDGIWTTTLLRTPSEDDNNSPDISEN